MDRKLIDYFPSFLQEYEELKIIANTEQAEIEEAWKATEKLLEEPFVYSQNNYGASRLEKILGIQSLNTDTLGVRNFRILLKLREILPYTYRTVKKHLTEMCEGKECQFEIDTNNFTTSIIVEVEERQKLRELLSYLDRVLPSNLIINFTSRKIIQYIQKIMYEKKIIIRNEFHPRSNIPYLMYDGTAKYNGIYRYNKYKSSERIELYPIQLKMKSEIKPQIIFLPEIRMKNIFKAPIYTETKLIYKKDIPIQSKFETKLKIKKETISMPKYKINLKIGKHLTKYNSAARYDGTKQYYVENEEII